MRAIKICLALALISSTIAIGIIVSDNVSANPWTVGVGGQFPSISAALASPSVQDGHTITVLPGVYTDNVNIVKRVTITGNNPNLVTIFPTNNNLPVFDINIDSVSIKYLTIQGNSPTPPASICGVRSDVTAREHWGITLEGLHISLFNTGIRIQRSNSGLPYPNTHSILGCTIFHNNKGVYIDADPSPPAVGGSTCTTIGESNIYSNTFFYTGSICYGIEIHGNLNYIRNSNIFDHRFSGKGYGIGLLDADNNDIYGTGSGLNCNIYNNDVGLYLYKSNTNNVLNNVQIYYNGVFTASNSGYIILDDSDSNEFTSVSIYDNENAFKIKNSDSNIISLCDILNNIASGYDQNVNENLIDLISGSDLNEIKDCTITTNVDNDISCIHFSESDSNTIKDNTFDGNIYMNQGSDSNKLTNIDDILRIVMNGNSDSNTITGCTITGVVNGNPVTAVSIHSCSYIYFINCDVGGNYGFNIGQCTYIYITNCDIDAVMYGIFIHFSSNIYVTGCTITDTDTGMQIESSTVVVDDVTMTGVTTWFVFVAYSGYTSVTIKNCNFQNYGDYDDMVATTDGITVSWSNIDVNGSPIDNLGDDVDWDGLDNVTIIEL